MHSYVWHDAFIHLHIFFKYMNNTWIDQCALRVRGASIRVIRMCGMTHFKCITSHSCVTWAFCMCDMTYSYIWNISLKYMNTCIHLLIMGSSWRIYMCHSCVTHKFYVMCVTWLISCVWSDSYYTCDMTHFMCVTWLVSYVLHAMCVTWLISCVLHDSFYVCDMTHFMCGTWLISCVWRDSFYVCDVTHSMCVTWLVS